MSIMGQTSRCCIVCLMPQSQVSGSLENSHFNMVNIDRPTCVRYRAYLAGQQWIGNTLYPSDWGWQYTDGSLVPLTTDQPVVPTRVLRIVSRGCKTGCRKTSV